MRHRKLQFSFLAAAALSTSAVLIACSADRSQSVPAAETRGDVAFELQAASGVTLNTVSYTIIGPASFSKSGSFDVSQSSKIGALIGPLPVGVGYTITLNANSVEGTSSCSGSAQFDVVAHQTTPVPIGLTCHEGPRTGSVMINGALNICPTLDSVGANPAEVLVGTTIALSVSAHDSDAGPVALSYRWTAASGSLSDANSANPTFTCLVPGSVQLSVSASDGDPLASCADTRSITVQCSVPGGGGSAGSSAGGASNAGSGGTAAGGTAAGGTSGGFGGTAGSGTGGTSGAAGAGTAGSGGAGGAAGDHLVVYRVGDGSGSLVNSGNPVFIDEYASNGALVRSIPMPLAVIGANRRLVASGTATSEGLITRSTDGHFVMLTGYDAPLPTASLAGTTGTAVPRIVGRVAADGSVDTSTQVMDGVSGNNPRGVASTDGNQIWFAGAAGGVRFLTLGNTSATTTQLSTTVTNLRQVSIFSSQLYVSDSSGSAVRLGAVGAGLPTTSGQVISNISGFPLTGSPYAFYFADLDATVPGVDVLYVADDGVGLTKYSLVTGTWVAKGTVGTAADAYRGLTAVVNAGTVTLYATRKGGSAAAGGGELVLLSDATGYSGGFTGTPTLLVTAAANTAFRGVALAPAP
ncbi:MAG TPA: hypothetical protein VER96_20530 [Polyangiaceae bacterium]|nr:hypothetical protein [Polyangiaceae bacterium]